MTKRINRPVKNPKPRGSKSPCKCLSCAVPWRENYEDVTMLVCGDEACYMNCKRCAERPVWCYKYTPVVGSDLIEKEIV